MGYIFIGSNSISGSFASLVGQGLEGGGGRGHPDFERIGRGESGR
jgi:hypothetical protein